MKYTVPLIVTSIDHHARRDLAGDVGKLGRLLLGAALLPVDVRLQASVEIVHAHTGVDDGDHDQDQGDDGEEGHRGPGGQILRERGRRVHSVQLEAEVGHGSEEE